MSLIGPMDMRPYAVRGRLWGYGRFSVPYGHMRPIVPISPSVPQPAIEAVQPPEEKVPPPKYLWQVAETYASASADCRHAARLPEIPLDWYPRVAFIINQTAMFYNISLNDLVKPCRFSAIVAARQMAMYLCRELTIRSMSCIGKSLGDMDHTTVLHGHRKIGWLIAHGDVILAAHADAIASEIWSILGMLGGVNNAATA